MKITIKKEHLNKKIAYGGSAKPLGKRTDHAELALIARKSNSPRLIALFEDLPTLEVLLKSKTDQTILDAPAAIDPTDPPGVEKPAVAEKPVTPNK